MHACLHAAFKNAIMEAFFIKIKFDLMGNKHRYNCITLKEQRFFFGLLCLKMAIFFSKSRSWLITGTVHPYHLISI